MRKRLLNQNYLKKESITDLFVYNCIILITSHLTCTYVIVCCIYALSFLKSVNLMKGPVSNYGEGGGVTKREGGRLTFYPYEKEGWFYPCWRGGT